MAALENDNDRDFASFLPAFFVLLVGAIFGGSMVFVTPPFDVPEELQHFLRSYQCSQGTIWATPNGQMSGGDMPVSLHRVCGLSIGAPRNENELQVSVHNIKEGLAVPLDPQEHDFAAFPVTSRYSPVCYLPSATAIGIGRGACLTALRELYIGRAGTLIGYLLLVIAAIWLTPVQKWTMALVALMPMSIFLAASLSADALSIAVSLLAIATILRAALQRGIAGRRGLCGLGAVLAALALVKPGYVLISFLFLAVPAERFSSRAACWRVRALMIGMPLALSAAWLLSIRDLNVPLRPCINMHAQAQWMFDHPGEYLKLLVGGLTRFDVYGRAIATLGWGTIFLRIPVYWIYWAALLATALLDGGRQPRQFPLSLRLGSATVHLLVMSAIATLTYLTWDSIGAGEIEGVQPRYVVPVLPLLLLPFRGGAKIASHRFSHWIVPVITVAIVLIGVGGTWKAMIERFYWH